MDTRFGIKDFILFVVLGLVIVMIGLAMLQFDRQWDDVQNIKTKLDQQAADLRQIQQQIAHGAVASATTTAPTSQASNLPAAEQRILLARQKPDFAEGDWLVTGESGKFQALTPMISGDAYAADVQGNVIESLCGRDPITLEWQGLIAESWTIDDTSAQWEAYAAPRRGKPVTEEIIKQEPNYPPSEEADAQKAYIDRRLKEGLNDDNIGAQPDCPPAETVRFKLRHNASFSDGVPVTADDVVFGFNFTMNPAIDAPRERAYMSRIRDVKKINDYEVAIVFRQPYFKSFELAGGFSVYPKHFYENFKPEEFNASTGLLMGSGPYMMEDPKGWKPGKTVQVIRNPRYWGVPGAFDRLVYREYTNGVALQTAFTNGEFDSFECKPEQFLALKKDPKVAARTQSFEYQSIADSGYRYIGWQQQRYGKPTIFADKRIRQAMTLLTDQQRLLKEVMLGMALPASGPFNPNGKQADPAIKPYPYDPARAGKLLADAGWTDRDNSGVLTNAAGQPLEFRLTYPSGIPNYEKMILLLKDFYARAKVRLIPDPQEWSVFHDRLKNREYDAITLAWGSGIEDDIFQAFHSSQMAAGGDDHVGYRNDELDKVIEQARRTLDEPQRMQLWHRAHQILYEDQPYTFLFFPEKLVLIDSRIANIQKLPLGLNSDSEWYVPKDKQRWTK